MNRQLIFLFLLGSVFQTALSQSTKFADGVISNNGVFGLTLSRDGKTAVFVNSRRGRDTLTIVESEFVKGKWSKPVSSSFSPKPGIWKDIDPFFSPKGDLLLFNSTRPTPANPSGNDFNVWAVRRTDRGWGNPFPLDAINSNGPDFYATMSSNGNIYFSSRRSEGRGLSDIYLSVYRDGEYLTPVLLGDSINTTFDDANPYISPDEDFIIFLSDRPGGAGDSDLFISFSTENGWSTPKNLGNEVNTNDAEFCPFYHSKSKTLYFGRIVRGTPLTENIFFTKFDPEKFK